MASNRTPINGLLAHRQDHRIFHQRRHDRIQELVWDFSQVFFVLIIEFFGDFETID